MLNRSKLWAVGLLIAVFVAGGAVGGLVSAAWEADDRAGGDRRRDTGERDTRSRRGGYAERLEAHLGLSPEQRTAVDSILSQQQRAMRLLWEEMNPKFDALRQEVRVQIMEVLDEQQQEKFRELIAQSDQGRERDSESQNRNR